MKCENIGTFIGCAGDGVATAYRWRGARLCIGCVQRDLDPRPSRKAVRPAPRSPYRTQRSTP